MADHARGPVDRSDSVMLRHEHVTKALLQSDDNGETINLANWRFKEMSEESALELANVGKLQPDDEGVVARYALMFSTVSPTSDLETLPELL